MKRRLLDNALKIIAVLLTVLLYAVMIIFVPILGYAIGYAIKLIMGGVIVTGLNTLFDTTRFAKESIPHVCAVLALIGMFFKTSSYSNKSDNHK